MIEVLKVEPASAQSFTVNAAALEVDIDAPGVGVFPMLESAAGYTYFQEKDNCLILGMGVFMPYSYCLSTLPLKMSLYWVNDAEDTEFEIVRLYLPFGNGELSFLGGNAPGLFVPFPAFPTGQARLALEIEEGKVSMVNAPESITGSLDVVPWVRIQHNLDLNGGPS